jgi:transposase
MKIVDENVRKEIIAKNKNGISIAEIAKDLGVSATTVKKYTKEVKVKRQKSKSGRPKKVPDKISTRIVEGFLKISSKT